jgi:5-methylthioadenosine/S-adenosylhomocysteine deaminase
MGVLGPHWLLIHMGWISDHDVQLLKKYDVKVAHCISASIHNAYGSCIDGKFPELVKEGVTVTLGPDSAAIANSIDMFREMFHFAVLYKEIRRDQFLITPEQALEAGTIMGARKCSL